MSVVILKSKRCHETVLGGRFLLEENKWERGGKGETRLWGQEKQKRRENRERVGWEREGEIDRQRNTQREKILEI